MRAVQYTAFNTPPTVTTVPDPTPTPDGVVLAVRASGLCRSDYHGWQGHDPDIRELPHVPGHELAGEVVAVGREVTRWRVGDRVTTPFVLGCGRCDPCRTGDHQICDEQFQPGFHGWGSFAEYVALPYADVNLVRLPHGLSDVHAASLGCRFGTAFRGVVALGQVRGGEVVAVFGCGGVGLSCVMIAAALGATVIGVDIDEAALSLARDLGAAHTLNAREIDDIPDAIRDLTQGGAHVTVDALGSAPTARDAILSLRKRGRHVQIGLLVGDDADPSLPMGAVIGKELAIYGSHGMAAHAYPDMLRMVTSGVLPVEKLVSRTISLDDAPAALIAMGAFAGHGVTVIDEF